MEYQHLGSGGWRIKNSRQCGLHSEILPQKTMKVEKEIVYSLLQCIKHAYNLTENEGKSN
jgi:hypothetical protein